MAYSSRANIAPQTFSRGGGSVNLSIGANGASYVKSISPKASNIFNNVYILSDKDNQFRPIVKFDSSGGGLDSAGSEYFGAISSDSLVLCNESDQVIELVFALSNFDNDDDLIGNNFVGRNVNTILKPNDFMYLPHNIFFTYDHDSAIGAVSAGTKEHTASANEIAEFVNPDLTTTRPDSKTRISAGLLSSGVLINNVSNHASGDTTLTVDSNYFFKVNDVIGIIKDGTSTHEYLRVLAVPSATTLDVERAVLGSTAGQLNNDTDIRLYYLNEVIDTVVKTNSNGIYKANTFFGYGRSSASLPQGLTMGSVSVRMREPAYQEFGLTGQTPSISTGLSTSTSYDFKLTNDANTIQTITIVTSSSNTNWGGTAGVLSKINSEFITLYKAGTFTYLPTASIVNGDIRITSGSRLSTSAITLADGVSNNLLGGSSGRIPNVDNFITRTTKFPEDYETEKIIFDDGNGNLLGGQGTGSIDYDSGAISLNTFKDAQFEVSAYYNSTLSGGLLNSDSDGTGKPTNPRINTILAKSLNPFRDAKVRVIVFDPEEVDPREVTSTSQSGSGSGKR